MILYKRHKQDCQYRNGAGKDRDHSHRCLCSVWVEWNAKGKQQRHPVRDNAGQPTSSWSEAEKLASQNVGETGNPSVATKAAAVTVADAVATFLKHKEGHWQATTLAKAKLTLQRLQDFCDSQGITLLADVDTKALDNWKLEWTFKSPIAKRNNQERVRAFFRRCFELGDIPKNPTLLWEKVKVKNQGLNVNPLEPKEYAALLKAVDHVKAITPTQSVRVKALMQLQRWSGLSLVDAVCLSKDELVEAGGVYRVVTERQKTEASINNVIPSDVAKLLLEAKNGNPKYFFWTGTSTPKSAVSYFDKLYRKVFKQAKIPTDGKLSHRFRHTFSVELLKAGVDIRKVSKALGHSSVTITERYYAKWNKAQQDLLDSDLTGAWGKR
jgi:integrase/recombinase XerD